MLLHAGSVLVCTILAVPSVDRPVWTPADAAIIVECVDIEDRDRRLIITQLIDDHVFAWEDLRSATVVQKWVDRSPDEQARWEAAQQSKLNAFNATSAIAREIAMLRKKFRNVSSAERTETLKRIHELQKAYEVVHQDLDDARAEAMDLSSGHVTRNHGGIDAFIKQSAALCDRLESDVAVLLEHDELERWEHCRAAAHRRAALRGGSLEGEHLDLDLAAASTRPSLSAESMTAIEPLLASWRADIDAALDARDTIEQPLHLHGEAARDPGKASAAIAAWSRVLKAQRRVRDTTLDYLERICAALPPLEASNLRTVAMELAFPARFFPSRMSRAIDRAMEERPDQAEALLAILDTHEAKLRAIRDRQIEVVLEFDGYEQLLALAVSANLNRPDLHAAHDRMLGVGKAYRINERETIELLQKCVGRSVARRLLSQARRN